MTSEGAAVVCHDFPPSSCQQATLAVLRVDAIVGTLEILRGKADFSFINQWFKNLKSSPN